MDRAGDEIFKAFAYCYLFGFSKLSEILILFLGGIFLGSTPGVLGNFRKAHKAAWAISLRTGVQLFEADYHSPLTGVSWFFFYEASRRVYPRDLAWSAGLKKEDFPHLEEVIPFRMIPIGLDYKLPCTAVYYGALDMKEEVIQRYRRA